MNIIEKLNSDCVTYLSFKTSKNCIKYSFSYNSLSVGLYYDNYDVTSDSLILVLSINGVYYYTTLNYSNFNIPNQYFSEIYEEILKHILDDAKSLKSFLDEN